jgi:hypothetical protein
MPTKKENEDEIIIPDSEQDEPSETDKLLAEEGYTEDELSDLSQEEKDAILDGIQNPETDEDEEGAVIDEDSLKAIAGDEEEEPEEKPAEKAAKEAPVEDVEAEEEVALPTDSELLAYRPSVTDADIKVELPGLDVVPEEIQKQFDELADKFESGDLSRAEYDKGRDDLNRKVFGDNLAARDKAKAAAVPDIIWEKEQVQFFAARPGYGGEDLKSKALLGALSETVKTLSSDPKNAKWTGMQLLIEADKQVKEIFGRAKPASAAASGKKVETVKKDGKPPANIPDIVTLGDLPAASSEDVGDDPFAAIDNLSGAAYEAALERMTPAQREAYEAGASKPTPTRKARA